MVVNTSVNFGEFDRCRLFFVDCCNLSLFIGKSFVGAQSAFGTKERGFNSPPLNFCQSQKRLRPPDDYQNGRSSMFSHTEAPSN